MQKKTTKENENANNCGRRVLDSFFFDNREYRTQVKGSIVGRSDFTKNKNEEEYKHE